MNGRDTGYTLMRRKMAIAVVALLPLIAEAAETPKATPKASAKAADKATEQMQLETTTITGHHELPRVLYIVPWKRAEAGELPGRPPDSLLDEALMPLDRPEFRREMRYSDQLVADRAAATAATPNQPSQSKSTGE
jgi:hypothetical protein